MLGGWAYVLAPCSWECRHYPRVNAQQEWQLIFTLFCQSSQVVIIVVVGCWLVAVAPLFSLVFALLSPFSCVLTLWLFIPYRQRLSELLLVRDVAMDALSRCEAIFCSLNLLSNEVCTEQDLPAPIHLPEHMLSQLCIGSIGCVLNWFAGRLSQTLSIFWGEFWPERLFWFSEVMYKSPRNRHFGNKL